MIKLLKFLLILFIGVISSACMNNYAVWELNELAIEHMNSGDNEGAIARLLSCVDLDEKHYQTRYNLAMAYKNTKECEKALPHAEVALTLIKKEPAIHSLLGDINTCCAEQIYEEKNKAEETDKIKLEKAQKYVKFLTAANEYFDTYTKMMPGAEDINSIYIKMKYNKQKIDSKIEEYGSKIYANNTESTK